MKKKSLNLFNLIKSLTKSEKRYFNLYAKRHVLGEKNNYHALFEHILHQGSYDEDAIKMHFKGESFVDYFSVAKRQLYTYLLSSLHEYHSANSREIYIQKLLHEAEILLRKGLTTQSKKLIQQAKKKAKEIERFDFVHQSLQIERNILAKSGLSNLDTAQINQLYEEEQHALRLLAQASDYQNLRWQVYYQHAQRGTARSSEEQNYFKEISQHPLLADSTIPQTFVSRLHFHQIWATLHFMQGQVAKAKVQNQTILELFHIHTDKIIEMPERYFSALKNYLVDCLTQGLHDEITSSIQYIRTEIQRPAYKSMPRLKVDIFCLTYTLQLNSFINQGNFDEGKPLLREVETGLNAYIKQVSHKDLTTFRYLLAYLYFGSDDFSSALKWVNQILNDTEKGLLQHIYAFARLFNLMIHFELGNHDILTNLLRNSSRYLQKVGKFYEIEQQFIKHFRKVLEVPQAEQVNIWKALHQHLMMLREQAEHRQLLQFFNLIPWVNAKIEGQTFGMYIKQEG